MNTYIVEIAGSHTVADFSNIIRSEELTFSEFLRSSISTFEGRVTNLVTFVDLSESATIPPVAFIIEANKPAPGGKALKWSGPMLVKGVAMAVAVYR